MITWMTMIKERAEKKTKKESLPPGDDDSHCLYLHHCHYLLLPLLLLHPLLLRLRGSPTTGA
jgi:hypothetical protein